MAPLANVCSEEVFEAPEEVFALERGLVKYVDPRLNVMYRVVFMQVAAC